MAAVLKVYADRLSQPSRALIIFCRVNKIDFEEITVNLVKAQHRTPEFKKINPMGQVPAIVDGRFRLFESHAILRYLATVFPGVSDHCSGEMTLGALLYPAKIDVFQSVLGLLELKASLLGLYRVAGVCLVAARVGSLYPADLFTRVKIESILDWHHSNLRRGAATFVLHTALGPSLGITPNPEAAKEGENLLVRSLKTIESVWLKGDAKFLNSNPQPSIADLSLVCEIMQLELVGDERRDRILGPREKIRTWMENVKKASSPHFEEAHELLFKVKARLSPAAHIKTVSKL